MKNIVISVLLLLSCKSSKITIEKYSIEGKWIWTKLRNTLNYPGLEFDNTGQATFGSFGDTIYYFRYFLKKDDLQLIDINNNKKYHNKILKLTKDSLIFENLLEHKEQQVYFKEVR